MSEDMPSLSSAGFIKDPALKLEKAMSYFFIADYSQSTQHAGRIASLPYLVKQHGRRPEELADRVESTVTSLLNAYFDSSTVDVYVQDPLSDKPEYGIVLEGSVVENGKTYSISKLLSVSNNLLQQVADFNIQ